MKNWTKHSFEGTASRWLAITGLCAALVTGATGFCQDSPAESNAPAAITSTQSTMITAEERDAIPAVPKVPKVHGPTKVQHGCGGPMPHGGPDVNDVVAVISMFICIVVVSGFLISLRMRQIRMMHETLRIMIEKGATIPPEMLNPSPWTMKQPGARARNDLRSGLILIAVGVGMTLTLLQKHTAWGIGMIPMLMGVAFIITWKIGNNDKDQAS